MYDSIVEVCDLPSGGVYSAVGTYDHMELVSLVVELSAGTGLAADVLVQAFGKYLFGRFHEIHSLHFSTTKPIHLPGLNRECNSRRSSKNLPEATLPKFDSVIAEDGNSMELTGQFTHRHFADLAVGLIQVLSSTGTKK